VATEDSLEERITSYMEKLSKSKTPERNTSIIYELYGQGSCYVYDSLPVSYAMFLRDPWSFESVIDTVNAGGDTDTNAKIVGELFGALHGIEFFENAKNRWMIDELQGANEIIQLGETFCDTLNIN
jgi:ADP-ribosylglycohydrolase